MSNESSQNLAERWFADARLQRISYGPMRRILANLLDGFGVDPINPEPNPQSGTVQTNLLPDTSFQLTTEFSDRLVHNLARFMNVDNDLIRVDIHVDGTMVIVSAALRTKEIS